MDFFLFFSRLCSDNVVAQYCLGIVIQSFPFSRKNIEDKQIVLLAMSKSIGGLYLHLGFIHGPGSWERVLLSVGVANTKPPPSGFIEDTVCLLAVCVCACVCFSKPVYPSGASGIYLCQLSGSSCHPQLTSGMFPESM